MDSILITYHFYSFPYVYMDLVDQILRNIDKTPISGADNFNIWDQLCILW